ncbi:tetratricopeptide repeat protein [Deinococcus hopiensis]|uniref:TPR repeat-containing protein n=1 Tax=Deinococcus hopiensis KR-140 TaxID=695939 RepID=A0A1W1UB83_9DEIO|nr:tetratricopeptide repeat protein [Deinococcus hopiensis]SMB78300.1 TPR repeat-containing protein [Deinococcus hopiensis KR-140]
MRRTRRPLALAAAFLASPALAAGPWVSLSDQTILGPEAEMRQQVGKLRTDACKPAVRDYTTPGLPPGGGLDIDAAIKSLEDMLRAMAPGAQGREAVEQSLKQLREQREKGTKVLPLPVRRDKGAMTFETAIKTAETLVSAPGKKAAGGTSPDVAVALAAESPRAALALLLAGHRAKPRDAMTLVNLAGVLTLAGLPREAIAVLDRAGELGGKLPAPGGVPGQAIALTNRGHAFLGLGRWSEAQTPLKQALSLAPDLSEARVNLSKALLCSGDVTGATRELRTSLRRTVTPEGSDLILTEDTPGTHGDALKPREQASTRRPARTMFDLSRGVTFDLPQLKLPRNRQEAVVLNKKYEALEREGHDLLNALHARAVAPNLSQMLDPGELRWYKLVNGAINTSVFEPEVWPAYQAAYQAHYAVEKARPALTDARNKTIERGIAALSAPITCEMRKKVYDDAEQTYMDAFRPYVKGQEQAMARFVSARVKLETALAANIPDPRVRAARRAGIEASAKASFYGPVVYAAILLSDVTDLDTVCAGALPNVPLDLAELPNLGADPCGGVFSSMKLKSKVPSAALKGQGLGLSWSLSCKKIDIELSTSSLMGTDWLGGFASASLDWNGNATLFTGVKAELKILKGVPATGGIGTKEGVYIKFGQDGIQDAGMRVELKGSLGGGPDASTGLWEGKIEQEFGVAAAVAYWRER